MEWFACGESNAGQTMFVARCLLRLPTVEPMDWHGKFKLITSKQKFVGFVRCPDCLSANVRLVKINDGK